MRRLACGQRTEYDDRVHEFTPDDVHGELSSILSSQPFQRSERLRRFLTYIVEETLKGHADELKEYSIGLNVFDRPPSFDPRLDNIVRVHATRLRAALSDYYASPGRSARLCIQVEKGSYVPKFADCEQEIPSSAEPAPLLPGVPRRARTWHVAGVAALLALGVGSYFGLRVLAVGPQPNTPPFEFSLSVAPDLQVDHGVGALSPDQRSLAIPATDSSGVTRIWLRSLSGPAARPLLGTENAYLPFWSPDGQALGFFSDQKLKVIRLREGAVQVLCPAPIGRGASWGEGGLILFAPQSTDTLHVIRSDGRDKRQALALDSRRQENAQRWPHFLPDGRRFLFYSRSLKPGLSGIYAGELGRDASRLVVPSDSVSSVQFVPDGPGADSDGVILYVRNGALTAHPYQPTSSKTIGPPKVLGRVASAGNNQSYSAVLGLLIYQGLRSPTSQLNWFDHNGRNLGTVGAPGQFENLEISPDGKQIAFVRENGEYSGGDLWVMDLARGLPSRITSDPASEIHPVWSLSSTTIAFSSEKQGLLRMFRKSVAGQPVEAPFLSTSHTQFAWQWSPDGDWVLFGEDHEDTQFDLWLMPVDPARRQLTRLLASPANEREGRFSPDMSMLAYVSDRSGRPEVCLSTFANAKVGNFETQVSFEGGTSPRWDPAGKTLYFLSLDQQLMAVSVDRRSPEEVRVATPAVRFTLAGPKSSPFAPGAHLPSRVSYAVDPKGGRFLVAVPLKAPMPRELSVRLSWKQE